MLLLHIYTHAQCTAYKRCVCLLMIFKWKVHKSRQEFFCYDFVLVRVICVFDLDFMAMPHHRIDCRLRHRKPAFSLFTFHTSFFFSLSTASSFLTLPLSLSVGHSVLFLSRVLRFNCTLHQCKCLYKILKRIINNMRINHRWRCVCNLVARERKKHERSCI